MLDDLKFVSGAIAKKDYVPYMKHFLIQNGTVRAYNGVITLNSPIPLDIDCMPVAEPMIKAIANCTETASLSLTGAGRLKIQSGKFKAFIDCTTETVPDIFPEGDEISLSGIELVKIFKLLYPLIGTDASRPWVNGIYLNNQSCYVTNNAILCQYWLGVDIPAINIPREAIREIIRIGTEPSSVQVTNNNITFIYDSARWIKTKLIDGGWPNIETILSVPNNPLPIDPEIFDAISTLENFCDKIGVVYFSDGVIHTSKEIEAGARYELESLKSNGVYNIGMLKLLNGIAETIDLSLYPKPCIFYGNNLRGAIIGMKSI